MGCNVRGQLERYCIEIFSLIVELLRKVGLVWIAELLGLRHDHAALSSYGLLKLDCINRKIQ
jgi:hypothetical protein